MNRFQATTRARRDTSRRRKGFIVTKFITKRFETSKVCELTDRLSCNKLEIDF